MCFAGAPLYGELEVAGLGPPKVCEPVGSVDVLRDDCMRSNTRLVLGLKEHVHAKELFELTCADAALGRMLPIAVGDRLNDSLLSCWYSV